MPERMRTSEQMLEFNEEDAVTPELLDTQVQKAQRQLEELRAKQELIEKQKRELEELSRRQEELERGRTEMVDKLTRSLVILEREGYNTQTRLEQIKGTHESFSQHLQLLEAIDPKVWNPADLHKELSRALSTVDDARADFSQQRSRLEASSGGNSDEDGSVALPQAAPEVEGFGGNNSFAHWVQIGFALSLPLIIFGLLFLVVFLWVTFAAQ